MELNHSVLRSSQDSLTYYCLEAISAEMVKESRKKQSTFGKRSDKHSDIEICLEWDLNLESERHGDPQPKTLDRSIAVFM